MGKCMKCLMRAPYATLIATILCCAGVGIFEGTLFKVLTLSARMLKEHFQFRFNWLEDLHIIFIAVGAVMGVISLILLVVGLLATGSTRTKVYKGWRARLGGRISCAVFTVLTYLLQLIWIIIILCMAILVFVFYVLHGLCNNTVKNVNNDGCINFQQFKFLFPDDLDINLLNFCDGDRFRLCANTVEQSITLVKLSLAASVLVVISLIHYLMCLSANSARIKDYEKLRDLRELQYLQDTDPGTMPRDRF